MQLYRLWKVSCARLRKLITTLRAEQVWDNGRYAFQAFVFPKVYINYAKPARACVCVCVCVCVCAWTLSPVTIQARPLHSDMMKLLISEEEKIDSTCDLWFMDLCFSSSHCGLDPLMRYFFFFGCCEDFLIDARKGDADVRCVMCVACLASDFSRLAFI